MATTIELLTDFFGLVPTQQDLGLPAATKVKKGCIACADVNGRAIEGTTVAGGAVVALGKFSATVDNTAGANDALLAHVEYGLFDWVNSGTDPLSIADLFKPCYVVDNNTVARTSSGGTLIQAGIFCGFRGTKAVVAMGLASIIARLEAEADVVSAGNVQPVARNVVTANITSLAAYTVAANSAVNDNVLNVAGDLVLLVGQTTQSQNGLYVVGAVGGGTAPLTRAPSMQAGAKLPNGTTIEIGPEGSFYKNTCFKSTSTTAGGAVIGTNDPAFYPRTIKKTVTLVAGAYTIGAGGGSEPLLLLPGATVGANRNTANTSTATTGGYTSPTANRTTGVAGTAALLVRAEVAAGTLNNADISTVDVEITNC